jgi:DNA-binding MarR family transcriptional regulator
MASGTGPGVITLVTQVSKALHRRLAEELQDIRLKPFLALAYVRDRGGVSQQDLETVLMIDANGVVLILNELEAAGFSIRKRDPGDRRRHLVEITDAGRAALASAEKIQSKIEDEVLVDLSHDERETLRNLLGRMQEGLVKVPVEPHSQA